MHLTAKRNYLCNLVLYVNLLFIFQKCQFWKNSKAMEARLKELEKKANKHSGQGAVLTDIQERVAALEGMLQDTVEALEKTQELVEKNGVKLFIAQVEIKEKDKLIAHLRKELQAVKKKLWGLSIDLCI